MDPLVLLFLSKTEKVEEYLESNGFSNSLIELDNLDELNHNLDLFDSKSSAHLDFMNTISSSSTTPTSPNHHHLNHLHHSHHSSIEDDHHQLLDEESTEHSSFSGYASRLGDNSSPEVTSTQNTSPLVNYSAYDTTCLSKENNDLLSNSRLTYKEEMSPSSMECSIEQKKKKGPMPRQQEELCLVCGDRASGYHYNALTCEGCKGFFRRSITKNAVYQCKYGTNCEIDMYMRRKCQECRLKKCLQVGMRPECVVPEYQCAIKRENKRQQKELNKPNSTTKELNNNNLSINQDNNIYMNKIVNKLSPQHEELIQKLVYHQEEYENPSEEEVKKITPFQLGDTEEDGLKRFKHMTEMTILTVQLIVEFSKKVPFFDNLLREDQITLLKACSSEVMMLRCSRKYDINTDSILYANNQPYTRENYKSASVDHCADQLFNFCRNMCILKVDNAEYALLTAIVIFSERPSLHEPKKVEKIQEYYVNILKTYVDNKRQPGKCYFAKLLAILTELRTLGNINSEQCVSLKIKNKRLPPFLVEIWDIDLLQEQ